MIWKARVLSDFEKDIMWTYLGQNFLVDKRYILKIVDAIKKTTEKYLDKKIGIEIWPWRGAITKYLVDFFDKLLLFEKDESLKDFLDFWIWNIKIYFWDFLKQNLEQVLQKEDIQEAIIFWNLPYYITSPIFKKIVENQKYFPAGVFMIQKEVADKIKTNASKKSYLWWIVNYFYDVEYLFSVPPKAFKPAPKVVSAVVRFVEKDKIPDINFQKMLSFLDLVSWYKRKTLGKIFKILAKEGKIDLENVDLNDSIFWKRLEELDFKDIWKICWLFVENS